MAQTTISAAIRNQDNNTHNFEVFNTDDYVTCSIEIMKNFQDFFFSSRFCLFFSFARNIFFFQLQEIFFFFSVAKNMVLHSTPTVSQQQENSCLEKLDAKIVVPETHSLLYNVFKQSFINCFITTLFFIRKINFIIENYIFFNLKF
jgi:hypothetical protein